MGVLNVPTYAKGTAQNSFEPLGGEAVNTPLRRAYGKIAALNAGTAQLSWLTFGDSYAQKVFTQIGPLLQNLCGGLAGSMCTGSFGNITYNASTGTVTDNTADFAHWVSGLTSTFGSGASRTYGIGGSTVTCNTVKVFYVNNGGAFKVQVNGVDMQTVTCGSDHSFGIVTLSVTRAANTVTIVQTSGTPTIVSVGFVDTTVSGLVSINVGQGGIALNSITAQAWTNFQTFLADVSPDVMTFEMKENSNHGDGTTYAQKLATLFAKTAAGAPGMDVVGIGSPPCSEDGNGRQADQVVQNASLREACLTAGYTYYDTYRHFLANPKTGPNPVADYAVLSGLNWHGDGLHVDAKADQYRGMLMLRDLGVLSWFGRYPQQRLSLPTVGLRLNNQTADIGTLKVDPSYGLDLHLLLNRYFRLFDATGATERWRMTGNGDVTDFVPQKIRIGSATGPALNGDSATVVSLRQGGATANYSDLITKSVSSVVATLNGQSGTVTLDLSTGSVFVVNLTGNVTSWLFNNYGTGGQDIEVHFVQDATGSRTLAGANASIKLSGGSLTLTTTASKRDIVRFRQISGGYYESTRSLNVG